MTAISARISQKGDPEWETWKALERLPLGRLCLQTPPTFESSAADSTSRSIRGADHGKHNRHGLALIYSQVARHFLQ